MNKRSVGRRPELKTKRRRAKSGMVVGDILTVAQAKANQALCPEQGNPVTLGERNRDSSRKQGQAKGLGQQLEVILLFLEEA